MRQRRERYGGTTPHLDVGDLGHVNEQTSRRTSFGQKRMRCCVPRAEIRRAYIQAVRGGKWRGVSARNAFRRRQSMLRDVMPGAEWSKWLSGISMSERCILNHRQNLQSTPQALIQLFHEWRSVIILSAAASALPDGSMRSNNSGRRDKQKASQSKSIFSTARGDEKVPALATFSGSHRSRGRGT